VPDRAPLGITGSTGRLGGRVARRLAAAGAGQRLLVRDPSRAPVLPGVEIAVASYDDPQASAEALQGIETLLMVSAAEAPDRVRHHTTFIDAVVAAGVTRVVYTSFYGAAPDATFTLARDHWATEEYVRASGLEYAILRDNLYLDFFLLLAGPDGVIRGPAGGGRVAGVALDDIADAVVAVLLDPAPHDGRTYSLTGPEALTLGEVAAVLSRYGKTVSYHAETIAEAYASRESYGAPQWQLDAWVSTYTAIASGEMEGVTPDIPRLTGHPATSLEQLLQTQGE
jgi:NAD(P)H dehydrogenase (quinone)